MQDLIDRMKALGVVISGNVMLKHAGESKVYYDIKNVYGVPKDLEMVADCVWGLMDPKPTAVAGDGHGGAPLATAISLRKRIPLSQVRKEPKGYGLNKMIDSYVPVPNDKVAIVDDVLTTGGTVEHMAQVIRTTGAHVSGIYVILKRDEFKSDLVVRYLLTPDQLAWSPSPTARQEG
jgi:orotate phosphoribosyltransferase